MKNQQYRFLLAPGVLFCAWAQATCHVQLSAPNIIYPPATRGTLLSSQGNSLISEEMRIGNERSLDILVSCESPASLTLAYAADPRDAVNYRFGDNGRASFTLRDVYVDSRPVMIESQGMRATSMPFTPGNSLRFWNSSGLASGSTLRGKIVIDAWIATDATRVQERKTWQISGSLVVRHDN
ncbi:TPA: hypothetical protein QH850_001079 [Enterobacter chengduensis]|nr:hypothetical protein [Enterobacter chengduensis]